MLGHSPQTSMKRSIACLCLCSLVVGCSLLGSNSAERRVRQHFGMSAEEPLDTGSIRRAVERVIPLGTNARGVVAYLTQHGIRNDSSIADGGTGALSQFHWFRGHSEIVVNISYDANQLKVVYWSVNVGLEFDRSQRLTRVTVSDGLTGL